MLAKSGIVTLLNSRQTKNESVQVRACRIIQYGVGNINVTRSTILDLPSLEKRHEVTNSSLKSDCIDRHLRENTFTGLVAPLCRTDRYRKSTISALSRIL